MQRSSAFSAFRKPHEILSSIVDNSPFAHSRARNRSSGGSSVSSVSTQQVPNLLVDSSDELENDYPRSRSRASRSKSRSRSSSPPWDRSNQNSVPLLPMHDGSTGHDSRGVNLLSRTPSPYPQREQELNDGMLESSRLEEWRIGVGSGGDNPGASTWLGNGKLGSWLWNTQVGWSFYVILLIFLYGGSSLMLLIMNRFIMQTGVYKFGYPIATTVLQLFFTQILLYFSASITRSFSRSLHSLGLGSMVAPKPPPGKGKRRASGGGIRDFARRGTTEGGVFSFKWREVKRFIPLAIVYALKIMLSNLSFAYTQLPIYQLSRVGSLLLALILTHFFYRQQSLSVTTLSSCITMMGSLLMASLRPGIRFAIEGFLAGLFSTLFVAAYPIMLTKTHKGFLQEDPSGGVLSGDLLGVGVVLMSGDGKDEARAAWKTLHYVNVLAMMFLLPWVFISGEFRDISRNSYVTDVVFFWLMILGASVASWATFVFGFLLVKASTPLTMVVTTYPRSALQTVLLEHFKLPTWSWVGVLMCWGSGVWYCVGRRREMGISYFHIDDDRDGQFGERRGRPRTWSGTE